MYDLRVVVEEIRGFCDLPMHPGDYFEVRGGRIYIPAGKYMCLWALQSLMPMLPVKQRQINETNDWIPHTHRIVCPDPNGLVIFRIDRLDPGQGESQGKEGRLESPAGDSAAPIPPRLLVNEKICSGCRACELACSLYHESAFAPELARLWVEKDEPEGLDRPHVCRQCGNAACVKACPEGALSRDARTRAVILDRARCTGCGSCARACPFQALRLHPRESYPLTCDLCGGDPRCVQRCATGALRFGRAGDR
ncbi:TIGR04076 family protein [Neomoorella thermoacetica]|uniref:TIGR04076 family protein n=1 Tax=Neomoorella thermoacetica TaxID=1525 RepID=UPI0008FB9C03|nr:TIGR04076 family protein [Moorella thermoacetica]OIQ52801.1 formate dehydrogenase-O iron-sulfur subunit [Moorella thermoacetica]